MPVRRLLTPLLLAVLAFATYQSAKLAWAGHLARTSDAAALRRAAALSPSDATIRIKLADALQAEGADPVPPLEAAAALDPENASVWMRLGLAAEMRGDYHTAEGRLLQATRVSRQFEPRWTLANFYLRRADDAHFWPWVKSSLLMSYGDLNPIFRLCWGMSEDPAVIFERAIPERRVVLNRYLSFLLQEQRLTAAEPVATRLAGIAFPEDRPALMAWCNRQLDKGMVLPALRVWTTMCSRGLLPYTPPDPGRAPLTDGRFESEPLGAGFAWRWTQLPGVASGLNGSPRYLWFSFSGKQPESCEPLIQYVPLLPGAGYRMRFEYRTSEIAPGTGLALRIYDQPTGQVLGESSSLSSPAWTSGETEFTTTAATSLARAALDYRRAPGTTRIEGSLSLRAVSLERLP